MSTERSPHLLGGIDGSNPLGFLSALGALRTVVDGDPGVCMEWRQHGGAWRPMVETTVATDEESLVGWIADRLAGLEGRPEFDLRAEQDNTSVEPEVFKTFLCAAAMDATTENRREVDFAAAFGCEATTDPSGKRIADTALRTMSGSGNQHFLGVMRNVITETTEDHLRRTLFRQWDYADSMQSRSLRWDPADDRRYAYRWTDPGSPTTRTRGAMLGGNRLAIEALPLMPTAPQGKRLRTTGFRRRNGRVEWTWPIWGVPASLDIVRSLLGMAVLQADRPDPRILRRIGVTAVYRADRISSGYYRNFAPARQI